MADGLALQDLFSSHRFPDGLPLFLLVLYTPAGLLLLAFRLLFSFQVFLLLSLLPKGFFVRQLLLRINGCILGCLITTDGIENKNKDAKVIVSNHVSLLDSAVIESVQPNVMSYCRELPGIISWLLGYETFGSSINSAVSELKKKFQDLPYPVLSFPEECVTNGRRGMLKFSTWSFELTKGPIQPVAITAKRAPSAQVTISTLESGFWSDLFWTLFAPYTHYHIRYLASMERPENVSLEDFSKTVQKEIARALAIQTTSYTSKDKEELLKRLKHDRLVQARILSEYTAKAYSASNNSKVDKMVQQVKAVFPQVALNIIRKDIVRTKSVDTTLANILEGTLSYSPLSQEEQELEKQKLIEQNIAKLQIKTESTSEYSQFAEQRHLSFQERKKLMIEEARSRYLEAHPEYLPKR